ncbi:MAG: tRNA (guanine-N(1)-)-methyltransferase [Candidatus Dichloromethanomonas elyunquensis]|nr:MAG: tRNA (guanine-N(1)-)-methyltransferase [Candidatus Dichloromethanomonas elyunquensis]
MKFTILTIFPEMFAPLQESILKRAQDANLIQIKLVNFRDYAESKHKNVDDIPYGGGMGMVLKPEPIHRAVRDSQREDQRQRIILLSPQGRVFDQRTASRLAAYEELVFICGHYEGFDERIRVLADEEVSIGDFVLTGGEIAAMAIVDAVSRLIPGVLGKESSSEEDSHSGGLLEYPQYTRPPDFEGMKVPEVLLSGHHKKIQEWRRKESLRRTFLRRPELLDEAQLQTGDWELFEELVLEYPELASYRSKWEHLKPRSAKIRKKKDS